MDWFPERYGESGREPNSQNSYIKTWDGAKKDRQRTDIRKRTTKEMTTIRKGKENETNENEIEKSNQSSIQWTRTIPKE